MTSDEIATSLCAAEKSNNYRLQQSTDRPKDYDKPIMRTAFCGFAVQLPMIKNDKYGFVGPTTSSNQDSMTHEILWTKSISLWLLMLARSAPIPRH